MTRSCEEDPAFDYLLMLFLDAADQLTVLPTHRVVRGLGDAGSPRLRDGLQRAVRGDGRRRDALVARFEAAGELAGGEGRFGLVTRDGAWQLEARRDAFAGLVADGGDAVRALDVSLLAATLDTCSGSTPPRSRAASGSRYSKSAREAAAARRRRDRRRRRRVPPRADARRLDPGRRRGRAT